MALTLLAMLTGQPTWYCEKNTTTASHIADRVVIDETGKQWRVCFEHSLTPDPVNHPPHYKSGGLESIDVIEAFGLGFCLGNTVKYILRAGKKNPEKHIEDLEKAEWYLKREIERLKKTKVL